MAKKRPQRNIPSPEPREGNSPEKACKGKKRYTARRYAKEAAKTVKLLGRVRLYPYRCPYCPYWHLGTSRDKDPQSVEKKKQRRYTGKERKIVAVTEDQRRRQNPMEG